MAEKQYPIAEFITRLCKHALRCHTEGNLSLAEKHLEIARAQLDNLSDQKTLDHAQRLVDAVRGTLRTPGALN